MELIYITPDLALKTHDKIIEISGGISGVKNKGYIESPLDAIKHDLYYPELENKITHLVFSFNKNHGFNDGNKRTSIALGAYFLIINGLEMFSDKFIIEMENIAVSVADNLIDKSLLYEIIYSILNEEDYNESIKFKIYHALMTVASYDTKPEFTNTGPEFYYELL